MERYSLSFRFELLRASGQTISEEFSAHSVVGSRGEHFFAVRPNRGRYVQLGLSVAYLSPSGFSNCYQQFRLQNSLRMTYHLSIIFSIEILLKRQTLQAPSELHKLTHVHFMNIESSLLQIFNKFSCLIVHNYILSQSHTIQREIVHVFLIDP